MICDHATSILLGRCKNTPTRAPRLVVPSLTPLMPGHRSIRQFTTLHYCELHKGELNVGTILTVKIKRDVERLAKRWRPEDFKPDFEKARIDYVLTSTPEYGRFMQLLGHGGILAAAEAAGTGVI